MNDDEIIAHLREVTGYTTKQLYEGAVDSRHAEGWLEYITQGVTLPFTADEGREALRRWHAALPFTAGTEWLGKLVSALQSYPGLASVKVDERWSPIAGSISHARISTEHSSEMVRAEDADYIASIASSLLSHDLWVLEIEDSVTPVDPVKLAAVRAGLKLAYNRVVPS